MAESAPADLPELGQRKLMEEKMAKLRPPPRSFGRIHCAMRSRLAHRLFAEGLLERDQLLWARDRQPGPVPRQRSRR